MISKNCCIYWIRRNIIISMLTFFPILTLKFNLAKMPRCAEFDEEIYVVFKEVCYVLNHITMSIEWIYSLNFTRNTLPE